MRLRSRIFRLSHAAAYRLPSIAKTAHSFLWLHALDRRDRNDITLASYSTQAKSGFDTETHNFKGLRDWEITAFQNYLAGCESILVAGAGGGREMIALAKMGHRVVGFDAAADLNDACLQNLSKAGVTGTVLYAGPGQAPTLEEPLDALVIGRGVYHHISGRDQRIAFLEACRACVKAGAPALIGDFLTRGDGRQLTSLAINSQVERGDSIGFCYFHHFTREEIESELDAAGFDMLDYLATPFPGGANLAHVNARARNQPAASLEENAANA